MRPARDARGSGAPRRRRRLLFKLGFAGILTAVLFEGAIRFLALSDSTIARRWGAGLRSPGNFSNRWSDDYWMLKYRFADPETRLEPIYDPLLGWRSAAIEPGTYRHADESTLAGRRPVLLYGDSFALCVTKAEECWQGLVERSELGEDHVLLNHGVGGYGLDQIYLLFQHSIDHYTELDPIVVVAVLVDDDLDRSRLRFRSWPKPHLSVTPEGTLVPDGPVVRDPLEYLRENATGIRSYGLRYLVYGTHVLPRNESEWLMGRGSRVAETEELNRRILDAFAGEFAARQLDAFVLLFHGRHYLRIHDWREAFLVAELQRLGIPYVSSKPRLLEDRRTTGRGDDAYFFAEGRGREHYTPLGNEIVFGALSAGLAGEFDGERP